MKIVLDTNVAVSALINPAGTPGQIIYRFLHNEIQLIFEPRILQEYTEVLHRPELKLKDEDAETFLLFVQERGIIIPAITLRNSLPDPDDEVFLGVALAAGVPLITGNTRDYPPTMRQGAVVLSPSDFLKTLREK